MNDFTDHEYDATHGEADEPTEAPQPGAPTEAELAEDGNLYAPAESGDDTAVDENGDDAGNPVEYDATDEA